MERTEAHPRVTPSHFASHFLLSHTHSLSLPRHSKHKLLTSQSTPYTKLTEKMSPMDVTFLSNNVKLAGHLYVPESYKEGEKLPGIVVAHPGGGVKE